MNAIPDLPLPGDSNASVTLTGWRYCGRSIASTGGSNVLYSKEKPRLQSRGFGLICRT
jgi:hypothetical protein